MTTNTIPLTKRDIDEIEGIAALGMPIGGTLVGRLCADWRRLTAERDAARAALASIYGAEAAAFADPVIVPAADVADVPGFLRGRV